MRRAAIAAPVFLFVAFASGCGGAYGYPVIERTVGGQTRNGSFVSPYSYEHFLLGELAATRGDVQTAQDEFRMARAGAEDDPFLVARLADVVDRGGDAAQAHAILREGDALDPCSEPVWLTRGEIHARRGEVDRAIDAFARAGACAPESDAPPMRLAQILRDAGRGAEADAALARYLAHAGGAGAARARLSLAIESGDAHAAVEAVRSLLAIAPARSEEVRAAARTALSANRPELAQRLLAALPEADEDRELRLTAAIEAGDRAEAEALLAAWMPHGASELLAVARAYLTIGMTDRAVELARVALAAEAGAEGRLVLGRALAARGEHAEAAMQFAAIEPGNLAWPEGPIAHAEALAASGRPAMGAQILVRALARRPSTALSVALAEMRVRAGDAQNALRALEGGDPELAAARAAIVEANGDVEGAARIYAGLASDEPRLSERERTRAAVERAWARRERDAAIQELRAWVARAPEDLMGRARLAELLASSERTREAREVVAEVLPLVSDVTLRRRLTAISTGPNAHAQEGAGSDGNSRNAVVR